MKTVKKGKVKIGVLGAGRMAQLGYLPWIKQHPYAELAGVADVNEELLRSVSKKFGCPGFSTSEELIERSGADAVCVTTPPWHHPEAVCEAAEKGMHVLCEKPMAPTVEECEKMICACAGADVYLQIGYSFRFDPGFEKIKRMIMDGELGDIFQLRAIYDIWVPDLEAQPLKGVMDFVNSLNVLPKDFGAWRINDPKTGGGVYNDHGLHYVDMFRWLTEEKVTHVTGISMRVVPHRANEDHVSSLLKFEGGAAAYIEASLCLLSKARDFFIEGSVHGTRADARFEMDEKWYILGFPHLYSVHAKVFKYDNLSLLTNRWIPVPVRYGRNYVKVKRQLDWFINKISGRSKPHTVFGDHWAAEGIDGLIGIKINQAVYKSSETESTIEID